MVSPERIPGPGGARPRDGDTTLSVVVRVGGRFEEPALDETLFSLAIQDWRDLEVVVVLARGGDDGLARAVAEAVEAQPWPSAPRYKLKRDAEAGGAGALLWRAAAEAEGRFLTVLDAGEVAYQHGYAALVGRLLESGRAVAVGGCRSAHVRGGARRGFVVTKDDFTLGRTPLELFGRRFAPLCAHVFDRARLGAHGPGFGGPARAERDFLARVYAASEPDFSARHVFVCERRLRAGGLGGILYASARRGHRLKASLRRARAKLAGAVSTRKR